MAGVESKELLRELACWLLSFGSILLCCVLAVCFTLASLTSSGAYLPLKQGGAYESAVVQSVNQTLRAAATDTGIPYEVFKEYATDETIANMASKNLTAFPLLLSGNTTADLARFDAKALLDGLNTYYVDKLGAPLPESIAQSLAQTALEIGNMIDATARMPDASSPLLYGVLKNMPFYTSIVCAALFFMLFGIFKVAEKEQRWLWFFGLTLCVAVVLIIPLILIFAAGLNRLAIQPPQLHMIINTTVCTATVVLGVMAGAGAGLAVFCASRLKKQKKIKTDPKSGSSGQHGDQKIGAKMRKYCKPDVLKGQREQ